MKRFLIFPILGPLIGLLVTVVALSLYRHTMPNPRAIEFRSWLVLAYWVEFIPACLAAVIDRLLSRKIGRLPRSGVMLGVGYVTSFAWGLLIGFLTLKTSYFGWLLGFFGMVPSAVCSWLSAGGSRTVSQAPLTKTKRMIPQDQQPTIERRRLVVDDRCARWRLLHQSLEIRMESQSLSLWETASLLESHGLDFPRFA